MTPDRTWRIITPFALLALSLLTPQSYAQTQPAATITSVASGRGSTGSNVAPGGIITVTGTNLAQTSTMLGSFMGQTLPMTLGGVQVTIGGRMAPLFMVSPTMIVAQVPFETASGQQPLQVGNGTTVSVASTVTVAAAAPAVLSENGAAFKASDNSLVGASNPAMAGDILILYVTGLGQTTPVQQTGMLASSSSLANTAAVTASMGGQAATVLSSVASPGFVGLYQVAVRVPAGVEGTMPVTLQTSGANSPAVPVVVGMPRAAQIDPQAQAVYARYLSLGPRPLQFLTPAEARVQPTAADAVRAQLQAQGASVAPEPVGQVADRGIPTPAGQIPVRVYTPQGTGPFPVIVYFHGGGFVIATIDTYDSSARALTNAAGAIVVSVEYRKAPENKFPAAAEDAYAVTQWVINNAATINGRADRVAVAGESAGGNLSTVVCLLARDRGGRMPVYQALIYPVVNLASESQSYAENANAPFLTRAALRWFGGHYLPNLQEARNPYASPLLADLTGLPPATVITAGFDPLRDEGAGYADKLQQAGVAVDYKNYPDMVHEFFGMAAVLDDAKLAVQQVGGNLRAVLNR